MGEFKVQNRDDVIRFMQEMMEQFSKDHVSDLMKNRRVEECEALSLEYVRDGRFDVVAQYLIGEGSIDATVEDFKTDEPLMNLLMFFYCFDEEYNDSDHFTEMYILSEEAYIGYVKSLADSDIEVAQEVAMLLLGAEDVVDLEEYDYGEYDAYDESYWHITELTLGELIDLDDPWDRCSQTEEDEEESASEDDANQGENSEDGE